MTTRSYEEASALVGGMTEAELDRANYEADMLSMPAPDFTDADLEAMEREEMAHRAESGEVHPIRVWLRMD